MRKRSAIVLALAVLAAVACQSSKTRSQGSADEIRLGVFPNITHATGLVGEASGIFDDTVAPAKVTITGFNSGTEASTALLSGSIDATYIGPVPAASLFQKSGGEVAVISGAAQGGAALVVRTGAGIESPEDFAGKKIAIPSIGNTQDVALRTWLHEHGLQAVDEGGDVQVIEVDNPELPAVFRSAQVDAAWEPQPWPSLLIEQGLAEEFLNERTLWDEGIFTTTVLLVSTVFRDEHPDLVRKLVEAQVATAQFMAEDPERAKDLANEQIEVLGSPPLPAAALDAAWDDLTFTFDPAPLAMEQTALDAFDLGYLDRRPDDLLGIFDLDDLNAVLQEQGLEPVTVPDALPEAGGS